MPTDDERREVAARLRGLCLNPWDDAACEIAQCVGIACFNSECHGSDETPECTMALAHRLADLIEPSCDRDALFALADEMGTADPEDLDVAIDYVTECASRIREACGEEVS